MSAGKRDYQQDRHIAIPDFKPDHGGDDQVNCCLVGVFDGHKSEQAAVLAAAKMPGIIAARKLSQPLLCCKCTCLQIRLHRRSLFKAFPLRLQLNDILLLGKETEENFARLHVHLIAPFGLAIGMQHCLFLLSSYSYSLPSSCLIPVCLPENSFCIVTVCNASCLHCSLEACAVSRLRST